MLIQDFKSAIPIVSVLMAAIFGYFSAVILENRKQLLNQRAQAYADYMRALAISATARPFNIQEAKRNQEETLKLATDAKMRMCIYASPAVIRAIRRFDAAGSHTSTPEGRDAILQLVKAMRQDLAVKGTEVSNYELQAIVFGQSDSPDQ